MAVFLTLVKLVFALILANGLYRTALSYGAHPPWAGVAALAIPFTGFTLYFDSVSWAVGLVGAAWLAQAWASLNRYAQGRSGPVASFVFLYLTLSLGYPHPGAMAGVLVAVMACTEAASRRVWAAARIVLVGTAAAFAAALTYLPSMLSVGVTWRSAAAVSNDGFLTAPWSETLAMSLPSMLPTFPSWGGPVQPVPATYVAWFALPLLAFVDWSAVRRRGAVLVSPVVFLALVLLATAGPSTLGPLRWPARFLPYVALAVLVLAAVLMSRFRALHVGPGRLLAAGALLLTNVLRATSATPQLTTRHVMTGAIVAVAVCACVWLLARCQEPVVAIAAMAASLMLVGLMVTWYPKNEALLTWGFPSSRSEASAQFPVSSGSTLQLGTPVVIAPEDRALDRAWGALTFGNYARSLPRDYVNAYTVVGFRTLAQLLCMDFDGKTCPEAYDRLFSIEPSTGRTYADLMNLENVVLQMAEYPALPGAAPPPGWSLGRADEWVLELNRDEPLGTPTGSVVHTDGVSVEAPPTNTRQQVKVLVTSDVGGRIVFSRLAWPGYEATLGGRAVPVSSVADIFLAVDIPPAPEPTELVVTYTPPGTKAGWLLVGAGMVLLVTLVSADAIVAHRRGRTG
jgi:hypothetical protein